MVRLLGGGERRRELQHGQFKFPAHCVHSCRPPGRPCRARVGERQQEVQSREDRGRALLHAARADRRSQDPRQRRRNVDDLHPRRRVRGSRVARPGQADHAEADGCLPARPACPDVAAGGGQERRRSGRRQALSTGNRCAHPRRRRDQGRPHRADDPAQGRVADSALLRTRQKSDSAASRQMIDTADAC